MFNFSLAFELVDPFNVDELLPPLELPTELVEEVATAAAAATAALTAAVECLPPATVALVVAAGDLPNERHANSNDEEEDWPGSYSLAHLFALQ